MWDSGSQSVQIVSSGDDPLGGVGRPYPSRRRRKASSHSGSNTVRSVGSEYPETTSRLALEFLRKD